MFSIFWLSIVCFLVFIFIYFYFGKQKTILKNNQQSLMFLYDTQLHNNENRQ